MNKYAISDLHGRYDLYELICSYLQPDDIVYFLGDACDRGPDGWELLKAIYNNPQWIYLMGNHEHILMEAMKEYLGIENFYYDSPLELCLYNGGLTTLTGWIHEGCPDYWINKIQALPLKEQLINTNNKKIILTHAGYTPYNLMQDNIKYYLWNRTHIDDYWIDDVNTNNIIIVHGHTPTSNNTCQFYCEGHKINIDINSIMSDKVCLLNLNTLNPIYLEI